MPTTLVATWRQILQKAEELAKRVEKNKQQNGLSPTMRFRTRLMVHDLRKLITLIETNFGGKET